MLYVNDLMIQYANDTKITSESSTPPIRAPLIPVSPALLSREDSSERRNANIGLAFPP